MTLTELCEPFIQDVAELMRSTEDPLERNPTVVRNRLLDRLKELRETADQQNDARLKDEFERIRPVLAFFADDVINNSTLPFAAEWKDNRLLAAEPDIDIRDGRKRFFLDLDATLREPPGPASQRLAVFQSCLGLGYAGEHLERTDRLQQYAADVLRRLDANVASPSLEEKISPQAYTKDAKKYYVPVRERVLLISVVCTVLFLAVVAIYIWLYVTGQATIEETLGHITGAQ